MRRAKRHGANLNKLRKAQAQERSNLINRQVTRDAEIQKRANERAAKSADVAVGGLSRLQAKLVAFGGAAQTFETGMRVAGAAMRALSQPINLATTFEREFNLVRTLSDDVTTSTRQNLLDLASQVPQTQIEIARSAYNALSGGVRGRSYLVSPHSLSGSHGRQYRPGHSVGFVAQVARGVRHKR